MSKKPKTTAPRLLVNMQRDMLTLVDELAISSPATAPAELIAARLDFWLSTPADQLAASVDSKAIRSAQHLLGLLCDLWDSNGKGVCHV